MSHPVWLYSTKIYEKQYYSTSTKLETVLASSANLPVLWSGDWAVDPVTRLLSLRAFPSCLLLTSLDRKPIFKIWNRSFFRFENSSMILENEMMVSRQNRTKTTKMRKLRTFEISWIIAHDPLMSRELKR